MSGKGKFRSLTLECVTNILNFAGTQCTLPTTSPSKSSFNKFIKKIYFKKEGKFGILTPFFIKIDSENLSFVPFKHCYYVNFNGLSQVNDSFISKTFGKIDSSLASLKIFYTKITDFGLLSILNHCKNLRDLEIGINFPLDEGSDIKQQIFEKFLQLSKVDIYFSYQTKPKIRNELFSKNSRLRKVIIRRADLDIDILNFGNLNRNLEVFKCDSCDINLKHVLGFVHLQHNLKDLSLTKCTFSNHKGIEFKRFKFPKNLTIQPIGKDLKIDVFFPNFVNGTFSDGDFSGTSFDVKHIDNIRAKKVELRNCKILFSDFLLYVKKSKIEELVIDTCENSNFLFGIKLSEYYFSHRLKVLRVFKVECFDFDIELPNVTDLQIKECYIKNDTLKNILQSNTIIKRLDISHNRDVTNKLIPYLNQIKSLKYLNLLRTGFTEKGIAFLIKGNKFVTHLVTDCEFSVEPIKALKKNKTLIRWESNMPGLNYEKDISIQKIKGKLMSQAKKNKTKQKLNKFLSKLKLKK